MPTIWTYVRAGAILVGSSAALLTGGVAHADPAPAPAPADIAQQLLSSAVNVPQILQNFATAALGTAKAPESGSIATAGVPGLAPTAPGTTPYLPGVNAPIPGLTAPVAVPTPAASSVPGLPIAIPGAIPQPATGAPGLTPSLQYSPAQAPQLGWLPSELPALASGAIQGASGTPAGPSTLLAALP